MCCLFFFFLVKLSYNLDLNKPSLQLSKVPNVKLSEILALNSNNVVLLRFLKSECIATRTLLTASLFWPTYTHIIAYFSDPFFSCLFCLVCSSFSLSKHDCAKSILKWASAVVVAGCQDISDTVTHPLKCLPLQSSSNNCYDISSPLALEVFLQLC